MVLLVQSLLRSTAAPKILQRMHASIPELVGSQTVLAAAELVLVTAFLLLSNPAHARPSEKHCSPQDPAMHGRCRCSFVVSQGNVLRLALLMICERSFR